jgi:hypothetical protein
MTTSTATHYRGKPRPVKHAPGEEKRCRRSDADCCQQCYPWFWEYHGGPNGNGSHKARKTASADATHSQPDLPEPEPFPDPPAKEAFHGLAGDVVRAIEPHSEADPVALLLQTLAAFGNAIGRTAHFKVEGSTHYLNLFTVLVGQSSKSRKGTSWTRIKHLFALSAQDWEQNRIVSGLSSGEGLIWAVRDPIVKREPIRENRSITGYQDVESDPGVSDKRLLVIEPEFAVVLRIIERQGNTLSALLRMAWDGLDLKAMTKNSPARSTGQHISLVGHITADELRSLLSNTDAANGFGNRFLWLAVKRSKCLPDGGGSFDPAPLAKQLAERVSFARDVGEMPRDDEARELWHKVYPALSEGRIGLAGALCGRAEAQVMRLACLYALLDGCFQVEAAHLKAALALWDYCERSVWYIFGESTGNRLADEILRYLRRSPDGVTRNELRDFYGGHKTSDAIGQALAVLLQAGLARWEKSKTGGRPVETWFAGDARKAR